LDQWCPKRPRIDTDTKYFWHLPMVKINIVPELHHWVQTEATSLNSLQAPNIHSVKNTWTYTIRYTYLPDLHSRHGELIENVRFCVRPFHCAELLNQYFVTKIYFEPDHRHQARFDCICWFNNLLRCKIGWDPTSVRSQLRLFYSIIFTNAYFIHGTFFHELNSGFYKIWGTI